MKNYILQFGICGEGPISNYLISNSQETLIEKVKSIIPNEFINEITFFGDNDPVVSIYLSKIFYYNGFEYNMFFIHSIELI